VHNWMTRGIPASIKLAYPKLFLNKRIKKWVNYALIAIRKLLAESQVLGFVGYVLI
jgi:hypothetical protein